MANRYGLQIRAATAADGPAVADLFASAGQTVPAARIASRIEAVRAGPGTVLIALDWGPPSGLVALHWAPALADDLPTARLTSLLVAPDARRRGLGRLLLKAAAQAARAAGCGTLALAMPADDPSLGAFCDANGFEPAGRLVTRSLRRRS